MAYTLTTDIADVIRHIDNGVETALQDQIKKALMKHAEEVVEEAAREMCKNLMANLIAYRKVMDGGLEIKLIINDRERSQSAEEQPSG